MAILGTAELATVDVLDPDVAWKEHEHHLGLSREEFDTYLYGLNIAHLIHVREPRTLRDPLPLSHLRADANGFSPPQSFRYITAQDPPMVWTAISAATRKPHTEPPSPDDGADDPQWTYSAPSPPA